MTEETEMSTIWRVITFLAALGFGLFGTAGAWASGGFALELTGTDVSVSDETGATFGWWNPGKYDAWQPTTDEGFRFSGGRMLFTGGDYTIIAAAEFQPRLEALGVESTDLGDIPVDLSMEVEAYDLAISQVYGRPGSSLFAPWVGVTHLRISEERKIDGRTASEAAESKLWGATLGLDWGVTVYDDFAITGRLLARWASGDRVARGLVEGTDFGLPDETTVEIKDSVERGMWGADLGVRWSAHPRFQVEAGWSTRDWTYDDGPAAFSGPYLRMVAGF
jgi:hypothetical protein